MFNGYILLIIIFSSLVKGITGFGFALVSFPLLLFWYTPKEIIPILMICNLIASILIILQKKEFRLLDRQSVLLILSGGLFTMFGVLVLHATTGQNLVRFSGVLFIALTLYSLRNRKKTKASMPNYIYALVGALIGFVTGSISVSGPPLALFLNRAKVSNLKFREIFAWFSVVTAVIAIFGYYQSNLINIQTVQHSFIFVPILLIGTIVGKHITKILSLKSFKLINIVLTLISSILMIVQ